MKKLILITLCIFCYLSASGQEYLQEATTCFEKGDYECAKRSYMLFQEFDGKDMSMEITLTDECLRIRIIADGYFEDKEYEKARDRYKSVLEKNPKDPVAQKMYDECIQRLPTNQSVTAYLAIGNTIVDGIFQNMVLVEGGTFMMGGSHEVTLSSFHIGKYAVTQKEWRAVMGNNPSYFKGDDLPVESVDWNDVLEFLGKLNKLTGKAYRLPTEAEWEFAARGGNSSKGYQYAGSDNVGEVGWNNAKKSYSVGLKKANELGLYDMSGNVWEWCSDWYGQYGKAAVTDPTGPTKGSSRVLRGGSWRSFNENCCSTSRYNLNQAKYNNNIGFRIVVSP